MRISAAVSCELRLLQLTVVVERLGGERLAQSDNVRMPHPPPGIDCTESLLIDEFESCRQLLG